MEDYIINIELINNYLNNKLTPQDRKKVENRLALDNEFKKLFEKHDIFRNGLERSILKNEIQLASRRYLKLKWLTTAGITLGLIVLCIIVIYFIRKHTFSSADQLNTPELSVQPSESPKLTTIDTAGLSIKKETTISLYPEEIPAQVDSATVIPSKETRSTFQAQYKKPMNFAIHTARDTVLIGKEGTKIYINAHSFKYLNTNQKVDGIINFNLEEYYKLSDMILANLSTTADTSLLETAGMIHLAAQKNNQELKLIKPIQIAFPTRVNQEFKVFKGEVKIQKINWIEDRKPIPSKITDTTTVNQLTSNRRDSIGIQSDTVINTSIQYDTIYEESYGYTTKIREILHQPQLIVDSLLQKQFTEYTEKKLIRYFNRQRSVILRKPLLKLDNELFKVIEGDSITRGGHIIRKLWGPNEVPRELSAILVSRSDPNTTSLFSTLNMGWINCDRFLNLRVPKIKYKVKIKGSEGATIKMIFKTSKTLLSNDSDGDIVNFGTIPKNEPIYLIIIQKTKESFYYQKIETNTSILDDINTNLIQLDKDAFLKEIQSLNSIIN